MIIGIDGNEANVELRVGVSWYVFNILREIQSRVKGHGSESPKVIVFLREAPREDMPKETENFRYEVVPGKKLWSQLYLPLNLFLKHRDLSVFFSPAHYAPRFCPCPTVVAVHDVSYFYYPGDFLPKDLYQLHNWTGYSVRKARHVVAVSQTTKDDMVAQYGVNSGKVSVIPNGFTLDDDGAPGKKPEGIDENAQFFLYVGTLQPRKNIKTLLLGFEEFLQKNPGHRLYIAGKKGWLFDSLFQLVERHHLTESVTFLGYVTEAEKKWLLEHAASLVVPCLYEGFGVPVLEGFASAVPVIAARSGALVEVGQDAAVFFEPLSYHNLAKAMQMVVTGSREVKDSVRRGKKIAGSYSWKKTTDELLKILTKVANGL